MANPGHELERHAQAMRRLARQLVGGDDADDLLQESRLQFLRRPVPAPRGWLAAIVRHHAAKFRRGLARRRVHEAHVAPPDAAASPSDLVAEREAVQRLHAALSSLPAVYQDVLLRRYFQDLTPSEIATQTGTPLTTVKSQLQRGLAMLRQRLDAGGDWRSASLLAFGLGSTPAATISFTGALLMSTIVKLGGGLAAVCLLTWLAWPAPTPAPGGRDAVRDAAPQTAAASRDEATAPTERFAVPPAAVTLPLPLRLLLVDAADLAPLPQFAVRLLADAEHRDDGPTPRTDDTGLLTIDAAARARATLLLPLDDAENPWTDTAPLPLPVNVDGAGAGNEIVELAIECGPTYTLLFDVPPPPGPMHAALTGNETPRVAAARLQGRVHPAPRPWVRLAPGDTQPRALGAGPHLLTVAGDDYDGDWYASGTVEQIRGRQQTPVCLQTVTCGSLFVTATVAGARPTLGEFTASVYQLDAGGSPCGADLTQRLDDRSKATRFVRLAIGRYRVFGSGPGRQVRQQDIEVTRGATERVAFDFEPTTGLHQLEVVARSESGHRELFVLEFTAKRVDGTGFEAAHYLERRPGDVVVHRFEQLADGEWDIVLAPTPHLPPWSTMTQRVVADAGSVEFVCLDRGAPPAGGIDLEIVTGDGQPLPDAGVTSFVDGQQFLSTTTDAKGRTSQGPLLVDKAVQVLVCAAGRLPALLSVLPAVAPERQRVSLASGWGTMLLVVEPQPLSYRGRPLAGVTVTIDGRFAGLTDDHGMLLLTGTAPPKRIELARDGYVHAYGSIDPHTGAPQHGTEVPFFVVMQPR